MKYLRGFLRLLPLAWSLCRAAPQVHFMAHAVINASDVSLVGVSERADLPSELLQPSMFLPSQERSIDSHDQDQIQAQIMTLDLGSRSTSDSGRITFRSSNEIFHVAIPYVVLILLVFILYWYVAEAEEVDVTAAASKKSNGPWARAYREAEGSRRQAIDMLVRCDIVTQREFANEAVDSDRIEEFCWVAVNMLAQQPVGDWAKDQEYAKQVFDRSFKASFPNRRTPRNGIPSLQSSARSTVPPLALPANPYTPDPKHQAQAGRQSSWTSATEDSLKDTVSTESSYTASRDVSLAPENDSSPILSPPPSSLSLFEQPPTLPSEETLGASLRSLPLHLLGPTPSIFSTSSRGLRRSGRGSSGRGSSGTPDPASRLKSPDRTDRQTGLQPGVGRNTSGCQQLDCSMPRGKAPLDHRHPVDGLEGCSEAAVTTTAQIRGEVARAG